MKNSTPMMMPKPPLKFQDSSTKAFISTPKATITKSTGTPRYSQPGKVQVGRPTYTP